MRQLGIVSLLLFSLFIISTGCIKRSDSERFYRDGIRALERNSYHSAIKSLQRFVKIESDAVKKAYAYNSLGIAFKKIGQNESALQAFESAIGLNPYYSDAIYNLGVLKTEIGDENAAISLFAKVAELNTNDTFALEYLSDIYLKRNDYENARNALLRAKERQPYSARLLCRLAIVELEAGNINKALIRLQESLEQNPKYAPAIFNMAMITHHKLKNYEQAKAYYKTFLKLGEDGHYMEIAKNALRELEAYKVSPKADVAITKKTTEKTTEVVASKVKQEEPASADNFMQIARVAEKQKRIDIAVQNYIRVAELAEKRDETPLQQQALLRASELAGKDPDLNFLVGKYYFTRSMFKEAVPFLKIATLGKPKWYEAHLALGKAAIETGEFDVAALAFKQADTLKPQNGDALWQLALLYDHSLQIRSKAISFYNNFIERFPEDYRVPEAKQRIAALSLEREPPALSKQDVNLKASSSNEPAKANFWRRIFQSR